MGYSKDEALLMV